MNNLNPVMAKIKTNIPVLGTFVKTPAPATAEILGRAGFDFVVVDLEPGFIGIESMENMIRAIKIAGAVPFVRVSQNEPTLIIRALETGAEGIHVPMINSPDDARAAVEACRFPPVGSRPIAPGCRAGGYGSLGADALVSRGGDDVLLVAHIEDKAAVDNLSEICAVPGIDIAYVGPNDLSQSYGIYGLRNHPDMLSAFDAVDAALKGSPLTKGVYLRSPSDGPRWHARGYKYLAVSSDFALLLSSAKKAVDSFKTAFDAQ